MAGVLSARPTRPTNAVVAFVAVLGLRTVVMSATHSFIILGLRVSRLAKASCRESEFCAVYYGEYHIIGADRFAAHYA